MYTNIACSICVGSGPLWHFGIFSLAFLPVSTAGVRVFSFLLETIVVGCAVGGAVV